MCCLLKSIRWTRGRKTRLFVYLKFKPHLHYTGVDSALFTHAASTLACKQYMCTVVRAYASIVLLQSGGRTWNLNTSRIKTPNWTLTCASDMYLHSTLTTRFPKVQGLQDLRIYRWWLQRLRYCLLGCCCIVWKIDIKVWGETVAFAFGVDGLTYPEDGENRRHRKFSTCPPKYVSARPRRRYFSYIPNSIFEMATCQDTLPPEFTTSKAS
jgi:hypothetical protein